MSDEEVAIHYQHMCKKIITKYAFYEVIREVPTQQLLRVVNNVEKEKTANTAALVGIIIIWVLLACVVFVYLGGIQWLFSCTIWR